MEEMNQYRKERSDRYFIEHLHLFYNRPNLLSKNGKDGQPMVDAMLHKNETSENKEVEMILERLKHFFQSFITHPIHGGGTSLMQLKHKIREKVKQIKPR